MSLACFPSFANPVGMVLRSIWQFVVIESAQAKQRMSQTFARKHQYNRWIAHKLFFLLIIHTITMMIMLK